MIQQRGLEQNEFWDIIYLTIFPFKLNVVVKKNELDVNRTVNCVA